MNQHVKAAPSMAPDLSRRSFLVGTAATGLVLAAALWSTAFFAAPHLAFLGRLQDEAVLGLLIAAGAVIYAGAILALFGPRWLKALVRR